MAKDTFERHIRMQIFDDTFKGPADGKYVSHCHQADLNSLKHYISAKKDLETTFARFMPETSRHSWNMHRIRAHSNRDHNYSIETGNPSGCSSSSFKLILLIRYIRLTVNAYIIPAAQIDIIQFSA